MPVLIFWGKRIKLSSGISATVISKSLVFLFAMKNIKNKTRGSIILRVVTYGYKTWSVTLQEENRQRAYENRVMKVF